VCSELESQPDICLTLARTVTARCLVEYFQVLNFLRALLVASSAMAGNFIIEGWTEVGIDIVFILLRLCFRFS
jgi:hypothetical protein